MDYRLPKKTLILSFGLSLVFPFLIFVMLSPLIDKALVAESIGESVRIAKYLTNHLGLNERNLSPGGQDEWIVK